MWKKDMKERMGRVNKNKGKYKEGEGNLKREMKRGKPSIL
jgi:hypothetical protein